jgi:hypothetical protein
MEQQELRQKVPVHKERRQDVTSDHVVHDKVAYRTNERQTHASDLVQRFRMMGPFIQWRRVQLANELPDEQVTQRLATPRRHHDPIAGEMGQGNQRRRQGMHNGECPVTLSYVVK